MNSAAPSRDETAAPMFARIWRAKPTQHFCWALLFGLVFAAPGTALATGAPAESVGTMFQWRPFLAPFHAVVLHFPIGFITVACVMEVYAFFRPSPELRRVTLLIIWLSLLAGVIAATFGWMRASTGGYESAALARHRVFGLAVPMFTLATLVFSKLADHRPGRARWLYAYRVLLGTTLSLVVVAGHFGGNLTHGTEYLLKNAPQFVRDLLEKRDPSANEAAIHDTKRQFYLEKVQPVLAEKCYHCHGTEKQKGGYRLDDPEIALRGGDSELTAIHPGNPVRSHLVELILLPPQHDDVMPPGGKQPLSLEEIMTLLEWIRDGAVFGDR